MDQNQLLKRFKELAQIDETANAFQYTGARIHWKGLVGSSKALSAAALAEQVPGHHLFLLQDKEEAAYFLNDLQSLYPKSKNILFYPASYRVPYEVEQTDNANVVARAEVL